MSAVEVHASAGGETLRVGTLFRHHRGNGESVTFEYGEQWLAHPGRFAVDPFLPLSRAAAPPGPNLDMFGAFRDSAPDRWGRELMRLSERTLAAAEGRAQRTLQETDCILGVTDAARQGALRFRLPESGGFLAPEGAGLPALSQAGVLLGLARKVELGEETDGDVAALLAPGSAVGGARPKASVLGPGGNLAIAKFPSVKDRYSVETWEHIALTLARQAGIAVQDHELRKVGSAPVLVARRFDRRDGRRVPFLSAMSMLGAVDHEQRSFPELVDALSLHGTNPRDDCAELFRRMVFNIMVSNLDCHLRNNGFLWAGKRGWTLSPAYDINPEPFRVRILRTKISLDDGTCSLELALEQAEFFDLAKDRACGIAGEVATAVSGWKALARSLGAPSKDIARMTNAFEHDDLKHGLRLARGPGRPRASS